MRLFVALFPPMTVRQGLWAISAGVPGAKWVAPENLHLTLRFIGEVDGATVNDVMAALSTVKGHSFELQLAGVGQFGDRRQAHMLWAGARPSEVLMLLHARIEAALVRIGLEPERRKFHPHVTLARLRGAPRDRVGRFLADHGRYESPPFIADSFVLCSSHLGRVQADYRVEAEYPLEEARSKSSSP